MYTTESVLSPKYSLDKVIGYRTLNRDMKILFFTSTAEDYLADGILHGLRTLFGENCVDFPKCEVLYKDCPLAIKRQVRGHGFTLYSGLLDDIPIDRFNIEYKIRNCAYDLIVISDIWRQFGWLAQFRPWLSKSNCLILDGSDSTQPYPAAGRFWRRSYYWCLPRAHRRFLYFKREWNESTRFSVAHRFFPKKVKMIFPFAKNLRPISFCIPEVKIVTDIPRKEKDFPMHIVDPEVQAMIPGTSGRYVFSNEEDYYKDLQASRFGITTKRAGWDCMRHYEIAANGAVPCFRDLNKKAVTCAPHNLSEKNCIVYTSAKDLFEQITTMSPASYAELQQNALTWVRENTTVARARELIDQFYSNKVPQNN